MAYQRNPESFIQIESEPGNEFKPFSLHLDNTAIVPVGGGKDSVVTLEILGTPEREYPADP